LLSHLVETYEEQDDLILQQFESIVNALADENTRLKPENAQLADEISQLESNLGGGSSLESLDMRSRV
jgi:uncharacterized protein YdcH (DUF465 family)